MFGKKVVSIFKCLLNIKNPEERFYLLTKIGRVLLPEYRFKWPQMDWWNDKEFNAYLVKFGELDGMNTDRRWMLYQLYRLVRAVPGDTAECGVYKGAGSYLICAHNRKSSLARCHHVFDSFEGISEPNAYDGDFWTKGDLECEIEEVRKNLSDYESIEIHSGWIPERFKDVMHNFFCFVHIDLDLYEPTKDSIEFFYPRINEGGILLCDDYGFATCPGATRAIKEYFNDKKEKMISLSGGGGFIIKGVDTEL